MFNPGYTVQYTPIILLHSIILAGVGICLAFTFQCPHISHWDHRSKSSCNVSDKYVCLLNVLTNTFQEECSGIDYSRTGSKLVFQPFFNKKECDPSRYQPFAFSTLKNTDCVFLKSLCEEEGQVAYISNHLDQDTTCRCDYTKGYTFVSPPRHKCYCVPSKEDCTCYKPKCNFISQDYQCFTTSTTPIGVNFTCPKIIPSDSVNNQSPTTFDPIYDDTQIAKWYWYSYFVANGSLKPAKEGWYSTSAVKGILISAVAVLLFISVFLKSKGDLCKSAVLWISKHIYNEGISHHSRRNHVSTTAFSPSTFDTHAQVNQQTLEKEHHPQGATGTKGPGDGSFRVFVIGKRGAGKDILIRRLVNQDGNNIDKEHNSSSVPFKIRLKDGQWIPIKALPDTTTKHVDDSETDAKERGKGQAEESITESKEHECVTKGATKSLLLHTEILCDRQESRDSQYSGAEGENGANYFGQDVSLHPEKNVTTEVKNEKECSKSNTLVDIGSKNGSASSCPFADAGSSVIDEDHVICELLPIEDLVHQKITSSDNVALVFVIEGKDAPLHNIDLTCEFLIDKLDKVSCFLTNGMSHSPVTIVFTLMDSSQVADANEYQNRLQNTVPENMKQCKYSVVIISNNDSSESIDSIRNQISRSVISRERVKLSSD